LFCVELAAEDKLPRVCLGCGAATAVRHRVHALVWRSPVLSLLAACTGLVPWLLLRWLLRRTAKVRIPLCGPCETEWSRPSWAPGGIMVGACFAGVAMLTAMLNGAVGVGVGIACGSVVAALVAWKRCVPMKRPRVRHITRAGTVTLDRVHPAAAAAIQRRNALR
jgi:hypothetical protein